MNLKLDHDNGADAMSSAKSRGLFVAALALALMGLTLLDVVPSEASMPAMKRHTGDARSLDCIVASAIFAGVTVATDSIR